ncbi:MAG: arsenite methyltransferase [Candidatus Eisenbacteria bacterium]|uniref:Arsenite methyltransferase n=1 Tax=Eiseniibacteriota bacterium TaxID=2212470 RepID=A0A849SN88_UNCEI|nr:arsenite methyltransferase [Candidatus Eisenbacteria bacterium]
MTNPTHELTPDTDVHALVRDKYGAIAEGRSRSCCGPDCCGSDLAVSSPESLGYTAEQIATVPEGADLGLGCGSPLAHAEVRAGETVLDLGSGAGIDCFVAAKLVGPTGQVIGVDMTPAMVDRARANAAKAGATNVEFRLGEIEHLPVADAYVDLIVSNCVVNLSPDKAQVFREAFRALKPGGRMLVSDLVWNEPAPEHVKKSVDALVGCVAGASLKQDYVELVRAAGFEQVEIVAESGYVAGAQVLAENDPDRAFYQHVRSVQVRGVKRVA